VAVAFEGFLETLALVEGSKTALAAAAPSGRRSGAPLAEALGHFEEGLLAAARSMPAWRSPGIEPHWLACRAGVEEAARRAERFRLEAEPAGYEELYGALGDLMEPLGAFQGALDAFRRLGR
jgi:hypothetical protein